MLGLFSATTLTGNLQMSCFLLKLTQKLEQANTLYGVRLSAGTDSFGTVQYVKVGRVAQSV